jgi:glycosyltransferase involved in cell wall biosynthesis
LSAGPGASAGVEAGDGAEPSGDDGPPLDIGLYSPGWPPSCFANGVISYAEVMAEGLRAIGHRVRILTPRLAEGAGEEGGPPALVLSSRSAGPAMRVLGRVDAVRARWRPSARVDWVGRALRSATGRLAEGGGLQVLEMEESFGWARRVAGRVPTVVRLHGPWFINGPNEGADPADPDFARRVRAEGRAIRGAAVTSPSRYVLDRTRAYYGLALGGAEVIPNPVRMVPPEGRWRPEECEPEHVLFVGRFDRTKGGDVVIDAFARLLRDRPGARLTFVGPDAGLLIDGRRVPLAEYVERRLPGALADGRIRWTGRLTRHEIEPMRRRAAVTVVASRNENFPMSLVEAMAAGCPVVATRVGGAAEALDHGAQGLYCDPEDPGGLAAGVAALLADPTRAAALGRAAEGRCRRCYAPEVVAGRATRLYRRMLAGGAGPGGARP